MQDKQHNTPPDFDENLIEISDLTQAEQEKGQASPQKHWLSSRLTPKQRRHRLFITSGIVLIALLLLLSSIPAVREFFSQPGLTTDSASQSNLYTLPALPGWGQFHLDGHTLISPTERSLTLTPGKHTLEWQGEPFTPLACTITVPTTERSQDPNACQVKQTIGNQQKAVNLITFPQHLSLQQLPPAERASLQKATQQFLDTRRSSDTVQPGELYAYNSHDKVKKATRPLQATQRFILDTDASKEGQCLQPSLGPNCKLDEQDCRLFCTLPFPIQDASGQNAASYTQEGWNVGATIRVQWQYTLPGSQQLYKTAADNTDGEQYLIILLITREQGKWKVAFHPQRFSGFGDPNCTPAMGRIFSEAQYKTIEKTNQSASWTFFSGEIAARGCLAAAQLSSSTLQPVLPSNTADAYILYRFGVLLAADDAAHRLWPHLPLANAQQKEIVSDIAANPAFTT
ncbi:hypothetical protein EI42_04123 [Thermosporothrix hazakensis]|jgi:hypothetical protein|uniref:Uncharacterized protein n=2 Tax=Thermosporothrix TaxID=768650 RepID=A0A326U3C5_THEHA|nr:hypothetical protein [Thermosporothrix hazakensis]PZW25630.1 hypothetical protein EI42_04123 [Thermosporothrix hazakensis]BBH89925.1 hypothetical protein KTC_46760 [Thermosporothrix sp. COM3]GCE48125.1 hypothetical protein KTH_29940 [Thermosporothrix hazakensis]